MIKFLKDIKNPLKSVLDAALEYKTDIALWQEPDSQIIHLIIDFNGLSVLDIDGVINNQAGFVISPFNYNKNTDLQLYLIKNQLHLSFKNNEISIVNEDNIPLDFIKKLNNNKNKNKNKNIILNTDKTPPINSNNFQQNVAKAIDEIHQKKFKKVVLSVIHNKTITENYDILAFFKRLCDQNPHNFVSLSITKKYGMWIGSSPEKLLSIKNNKKTSIFATAGTQEITNNKDKIIWQKKEQQEQKFVVKYIQKILKKLKINYQTKKTKTLKIANIAHLKTAISFKIKHKNIIKLLQKLLPTPAVCGVPKKKAQEFIKNNEIHNRLLYAGCIGLLNLKSKYTLKLWTNIRCAKFTYKNADVFAGAGIISSSSIKDEIQEIDLKLKAILDFL